MTLRNLTGFIAILVVATATLATSALAGGEPKNQWPFTRPVGGRTPQAVNVTAQPSAVIRGEPKNQWPFTRPVTYTVAVNRSGFDWESGGIGAAAGLGIALAGSGLLLTTRKSARLNLRPNGQTLKGSTLLISVGSALALAASASASAPVTFTQETNQTTPVPNISCVAYGYGFDTVATFDVVRHYIQFYDSAGNLVKEIRHVDFTGTLYRTDDLSKTIPYAGKWTRTLDVAANTVVSTGLFRYSHPDGGGMITLDAGRTVQDARTFNTLSDTGPTQIEWQQAVCAYLAAE